MANSWLIDVESRGKLAFNSGIIKSHKDAESYAHRTYHIVIERDCFVAGWNMAYWASNSND